ncbi:hypothetical protein [Desulfovibrio inopinatus]|uniref:hypothetical protein n=1 Tax=Desulfovibrio inopinatus TaxID=102109 RepID=UPI0004866D03|nr:hypothetical protein [Desulfovibrio inopinatus]
MANQLLRSSKSFFFSAYRSTEGEQLRFVNDLRILILPVLALLLVAIGYAVYDPDTHPLSWIVLVPTVLCIVGIFVPLYHRVDLDLQNHIITFRRGSIFSEKTREQRVSVFQEALARPQGHTGRYELVLTANKENFSLLGNLTKSSAFLAVREINASIAAAYIGPSAW